MKASITFLGAAQTVTGSRHLLEIEGKRVLVDCGLFQGSEELKMRNLADFPVEPSSIDALVITHAHLDHIGYVPALVKNGFEGPIYATHATCDLAKITLPDSGRLQEEDAYHNNKRHPHSFRPPIYTEREAYACLKNFLPVPWQTSQNLPGGAIFQFYPAGHILGSGFANIQLPGGKVLLMSGDLGRFGTPLIKDPTMMDEADFLVVESTYGDRLHPTEDVMDKLESILKRAWETGSVVLVPSFAIGRTQELLYFITRLQRERNLPRIPLFVDSPMATTTTDVYRKDKEDMNAEVATLIENGVHPFEPEGLQFVRDRELSKELNSRSGPFVVIAGSGMANGGRIVHHLMHRLPDERTIVMFTGYQAEGTLGRRLLEKADKVHIMGQDIPVRASIEKLNALSAHADQGEIMRWLGGFKRAPETTFVVHGEPPAQAVLKSKIVNELHWDAVIPAQGDHFILES